MPRSVHHPQPTTFKARWHPARRGNRDLQRRRCALPPPPWRRSTSQGREFERTRAPPSPPRPTWQCGHASARPGALLMTSYVKTIKLFQKAKLTNRAAACNTPDLSRFRTILAPNRLSEPRQVLFALHSQAQGIEVEVLWRSRFLGSSNSTQVVPQNFSDPIFENSKNFRNIFKHIFSKKKSPNSKKKNSNSFACPAKADSPPMRPPAKAFSWRCRPFFRSRCVFPKDSESLAWDKQL